MGKDTTMGYFLALAAVGGILIFGWLLWSFPILTLQITAFAVVAGVLGIIAWIGITMARTPSPSPIVTETAPSQTATQAGESKAMAEKK